MCIRDRSTAEDAVAKADELLEKMPETDIVFFDLPGTVNSTGVLNTLEMCIRDRHGGRCNTCRPCTPAETR